MIINMIRIVSGRTVAYRLFLLKCFFDTFAFGRTAAVFAGRVFLVIGLPRPDCGRLGDRYRRLHSVKRTIRHLCYRLPSCAVCVSTRPLVPLRHWFIRTDSLNSAAAWSWQMRDSVSSSTCEICFIVSSRW